MKAMRFHEYGGPEALRFEDAPDPVAGDGEVVIRVAASAFNPADAGLRGGYLRRDFPLDLPHIPGYDVSGVVEAVGSGVTTPRVGETVIGFLSMAGDGGAAQLVVTAADSVVAAPTTIPLVDAAALPSVGLTAWQALIDTAGLTRGQTVLITGAGGSVGVTAIQLAVDAGARVIAVTSSEGVDRVRRAGADDVVALSDVADAVAAGSVDVLLNLGRLGADEFAALVPLVRDGGIVVNTVPSVPTPGDDARGVRAAGFFVHPDAEELAHLVTLVDAGRLRVDVADRLPLDRLADVHTRSDAGELRAKTVLVPPAD